MISRRLPFHRGVSGTIPFPSPVKSNRDSIYREKFGYDLPVPRPPNPPVLTGPPPPARAWGWCVLGSHACACEGVAIFEKD